MTSQDVVITGVGVVSPLGIGAGELFKRWCSADLGIIDGQGHCSDFDPAQHMSRKDIRRTDRFAQLAVAASDEAVSQAGFEAGATHDGFRVACVIGTLMGGAQTFEQNVDIARSRGPEAVPALGIPMTMGSAATAAVSIRHGIKGPTYSVNAACATGGEALAHGFRLLKSGAADAAIVGGSEAAATGLGSLSMSKVGVVSAKGLPRPFDKDRDGLVRGEGAGVLVFERREVAEARGARVLGTMLAGASTSDAFHLSAPEPSGTAAARAIGDALAAAGLSPTDLDCVNAHGTATILSDRSETVALKRALGDEAYRTPTSSLKSTIGHTFGAAGAIEAVALLLSLDSAVVPPTLNLDEPEEGFGLDYVPNVARPLEARNGADRLFGASNSFGFGGHNSVVILASEPS